MQEIVAPLTWNNAMLVSGLILAVTFVGIFTEAVHGFHRTKFAMGGAGLMILAGQYFGYYNTELAVEAVVALEGAGLARVDFLLDRNSSEVFINEVNSIPGFTQGSMYPLLWQASGIPYPALLDRLIELALERHQITTALVTRYEPTR